MLKNFSLVSTLLLLIAFRASGYDIVWNVPTQMCHKFGYNFSQVGSGGILQNDGDTFMGDRVVILYDPGSFPAILSTGDRNGGVPQKGDLDLHLKAFAKAVQVAVPSKNFNGIGIIDFEHWRPIWRENWSKLEIYRERSREIERKRSPLSPKSVIEKQATKRFEKAAEAFFDSTLALAKKLRPKARWGYYAFPYCFNFTTKNNYKKCTVEVKEDNDRSGWMWKTGTALFPSAYIHEKSLSEPKRAKMVEGRTLEAVRVAKFTSTPLPVYVYVSFKYQDTSSFLSKSDMKNSLAVPRTAGASGLIIWGSSKDTSSSQKCAKLDDYVKNVLLPLIPPNELSSNHVLDWF